MAQHEHAKSRSVRQWYTPLITAVGVLALTWTAHAGMEGAVRIPEDGYLYAEHDKGFTDARKDGLTVELWLRLDHLPEDNIDWPVISKEGSYAIAFCGWNAAIRREQRFAEGAVTIASGWYTSPLPLWGLPAWPRFSRRAADWPIGSWLHVAYQLRSHPDEVRNELHLGDHDGKRLGHHPGFGIEPPGTLESPLFIGGLSPEAVRASPSPAESWCLDENSDVRPMEGWIGEVRISEGWRYPRHEGARVVGPVQGEGPDADTIALWTFDNPLALSFEDESGNGHRLFAVRPLAVRGRDRLATTWARLKRE